VGTGGKGEQKEITKYISYTQYTFCSKVTNRTKIKLVSSDETKKELKKGIARKTLKLTAEKETSMVNRNLGPSTKKQYSRERERERE
jgi:hypothetical protein